MLEESLSEQRAYKNLDTDANKDYAAKNGCLACDFVAEGLADVEAAEAEGKGDNSDDQNRNKSLNEAMVSDGEADRKSVYRCGYALKDYSFCGKLCACTFLALVLSALVDHFAAYEGKQTESDPRNKHREAVKHLDDSMYANPTDKRHKSLEDTEGTCNFYAFFLAHTRLGKAVC